MTLKQDVYKVTAVYTFVTQGHAESQMNKSFVLARQASPRRKFSDAKLAGLKTKLFILLRLNMAMLDKGLL